MSDNPKAQNELSQAAKDYAKDNGYSIPAQQYDEADNESYYANPYSYWFGCPDWYADPLRYPSSFWFDAGLYFGMAGFGIWGMPGYGFFSWFFGAAITIAIRIHIVNLGIITGTISLKTG